MEIAPKGHKASMDKTKYTRLRKRQDCIEGWSVGVLGVLAIVGTTYASVQYAGW